MTSEGLEVRGREMGRKETSEVSKEYTTAAGNLISKTNST